MLRLVEIRICGWCECRHVRKISNVRRPPHSTTNPKGCQRRSIAAHSPDALERLESTVQSDARHVLKLSENLPSKLPSIRSNSDAESSSHSYEADVSSSATPTEPMVKKYFWRHVQTTMPSISDFGLGYDYKEQPVFKPEDCQPDVQTTGTKRVNQTKQSKPISICQYNGSDQVVAAYHPSRDPVTHGSDVVAVNNQEGVDPISTDHYLTVCQKYDLVLSNHLQGLVCCDQIHVAENILKRQVALHACGKVNGVLISTPAPFNILLRAHATQGNWDSFLKLFKMMKASYVLPDEHTLAYLLLCLCVKHPNNLHPGERVEFTREEFFLSGLDPDNVAQSGGVMLQSNRNLLTQAVKILYSDPQSNQDLRQRTSPGGPDVESHSRYNNQLVSHLNKPKVMPSVNYKLMSEAAVEQIAKEVFELEGGTLVAVDSISPVEAEPGSAYQNERLEQLLSEWRDFIRKSIENTLVNLSNDSIPHQDVMQSNTVSSWTISFLADIPLEQLVDLMMREIDFICKLPKDANILSMKTIWRNLGTAVLNMYNTHILGKAGLRDAALEVYTKYVQSLVNSPSCNKTYAEILNSVDPNKTLMYIGEGRQDWSDNIFMQIGEVLYRIVIDKLRFPTDLAVRGRRQHHDAASGQLPQVSAFYYYYHNSEKHGSAFRAIKAHSALAELVSTCTDNTIFLEHHRLPAKLPPVPWMSPNVGVSAMLKPDLMRMSSSIVASNKQLQPVMDALNNLSSIPWRVNASILDAVTKIFNKGGDDKLQIPMKPENVMEPPKLPKLYSTAELTQHKEARAEHRKNLAELFSLRCSMNLGLSVAHHVKDAPFYLPHNMDFRGRAYPISPYFCHLLSDPLRACFLFAKGKKLGKRGLEWLKIHLVNLTELKKKESNQTRLEFAEEILPFAIQSATTPFEGVQWWMQFDDPWQTLACCMELKSALESRNPYQFVSRLPIHQDGSCNGLQHYAALGRDTAGAVSVNVAPNNKPHDVYSDVAAMVEKRRQRDAAKGDEVAQMVEGLITRKVVKQPVMTSVYGVTLYGMKTQVSNRLQEIRPDFTPKQLRLTSNYIAMTINDSLTTMFKNSSKIQNWLVLLADVISRDFSKKVEWLTPLDLPITQDYNKTSTTKESLSLQQRLVTKQKPDMSRQRNGFPPNFIHSLDSTHMFLTSLHCQRQGIQFAAIHDCFWTHACDVDAMNKICREQFVAIYSLPILDKLGQYIRQQTRGRHDPNALKQLEGILRNQPQLGKFDIKRVLDSKYFFS